MSFGLNISMLDDDKLESAIKELIIDICEVMYRRGYDTVPIGAMMRLVGVGDERAKKHDNDYFALDEEFKAILASRENPSQEKNTPKKAPAGVTLH